MSAVLDPALRYPPLHRAPFVCAPGVHPVCMTLHLPPDDYCSAHSHPIFCLNSGWDRTALLSIDRRPYPSLHRCSLVPFARTLDLVYQDPLFHAQSIGVQLRKSPSMLAQVPWFSLLESLTIGSRFSPTPGGGIIMVTLLSLLARMPRLRRLSVSAPDSQAHIDPAAHGMVLPELPCVLEVAVLFGRRSAATFAHIISQSRRTLRQLTINCMGRTDADQVLLVSALAHAAQSLRILDLRLRRDTRPLSSLRPVFTAFPRIDSLHLETPRSATLQETLDLLRDVPVRALTLLRLHGLLPSAHIDFCRLQMPCVRSLILVDFEADDEDTRALVAYWNARRIRCKIDSANILG